MDAALQLSLTSQIRRRLLAVGRLAVAAGERGAALLWSVVAIIIVAMLGVAAFYLSSQDRLIGENFESGYRALYAADEALSSFYANFTPGTSLVFSTIVDTTDDGEGLPLDVDEYDGTDLVARDFAIGSTTLWVTPVKALEASEGDVYALEALAEQTETRNRPVSSRTVRTFAYMAPPFAPLAALMAPGGVDVKKTADKLKVESEKKKSVKCGNGTGITPLMAPKATASWPSDKVEFKPSSNKPDTSSTADYTAMLAQIGINWPAMVDPASYAGLQKFIRIPADYATLKAVPWNTLDKKKVPWPIVLVTGNITVSEDTKDGFGMLIISGRLDLKKKLNWAGVMMTGKDIDVQNDGELHVTGMLLGGLGCTAAEAATGKCRITLNKKKVTVKYQQCNMEVAWTQLLKLRPLTPSRHTVMY